MNWKAEIYHKIIHFFNELFGKRKLSYGHSFLMNQKKNSENLFALDSCMGTMKLENFILTFKEK